MSHTTYSPESYVSHRKRYEDTGALVCRFLLRIEVLEHLKISEGCHLMYGYLYTKQPYA